MSQCCSNHELISIIIPVYNVSEFLPSCLDSVLCQSYDNFELILVDDGSTDKSGKICDEYAKKDDRIRVFHKQNGGVSSARNLGLDNISGEWVMFVDADDYLLKDALQKTYNVAKQQNVSVVVFKIDKENTNLMKIESQLATKNIEWDYSDIMQTINNLELSACGKLYNKEVVRDSRFPLGIKHYEDYIYVWNIAKKKYRYTIIDYIGYIIRSRPNSASRKPFDIYVYKNRMEALLYACKQMDVLFSSDMSVRKNLSLFVIRESFINKKMFDSLPFDDIGIVNKYAEELFFTVVACGYVSAHMKWALRLWLYYHRHHAEYPNWLHVLLRIAMKIDYSKI